MKLFSWISYLPDSWRVGTHQNAEASRSDAKPAWSAKLYSLPRGDGAVTSETGEAILAVSLGKLGFKNLLESSISVSSVQSSRIPQLLDKTLTGLPAHSKSPAQ